MTPRNYHPELRARVRSCLDPLPGDPDGAASSARAGRRGDHDLEPDWRSRRPLRQAAVLVPLVDRPAGMTVLLTVRRDDLEQHAGQVSFPGGRVEASDSDPVQTALRETAEEVGIDPELVEPVGLLDLYETVTGFLVTPVVGFVDSAIAPRPDDREVAEIFEIPLARALDPRTYQQGHARFGGRTRSFLFLMGMPRYVWGATAGMLRDLCQRFGAGGATFSP